MRPYEKQHQEAPCTKKKRAGGRAGAYFFALLIDVVAKEINSLSVLPSIWYTSISRSSLSPYATYTNSQPGLL